RLKGLLPSRRKQGNRREKKKRIRGEGFSGRSCLEYLSCESFSELDPAVLALEEPDENVLLRPAALEFPDLRRRWYISTAFQTDDLVELARGREADRGQVR